MKKTIIIPAIALCFSMLTVNAIPTKLNQKTFNTETKIKVNSFCISIAKGDIETVKKLLSLGEDVNQTSNGLTPLMYAAKYNRTEILELLLQYGANLKARSNKDMTAINYAELHGAKQAYHIIEIALLKNKNTK